MKKVILLFIIALSLPALSQAKPYGYCKTKAERGFAKSICGTFCFANYGLMSAKRKNCFRKCYHNFCFGKDLYPL